VCRWLASKGRHEAAEQALRSLRGPDQIEADLAEMQAAAEEESKARSWALLRSPAVRGELQVGQPLKPVVVFIVACHSLVVLGALSSVSIVACHALAMLGALSSVSIVACHALVVLDALYSVSIVACHALVVLGALSSVSIVACHALVMLGALSSQCSSSDSPSYQGKRHY